MLPLDDYPSLRRRLPPWLRSLLFGGLVLVVLIFVLFAWSLIGSGLLPYISGQAAGPAFTATPTAFQLSATPTTQPSPQPTITPTLSLPLGAGGNQALEGLIVLSFSEQGSAQLFSHQLVGQPFTRLTSGAWDDIDPALNSDSSQLAFASNRDGRWDLYLLNLSTGKTTQFSDDAAFDAAPAWSSDGAWLAYEHDENNNLEIMMRPLDGSLQPVNLSVDAAVDYAPAWRPGAQQLAFVSNRGGQVAIWLVDLGKNGNDRFRQLTSGGEQQASPAWSADGHWLAYVSKEDGIWRIFIQDIDSGSAPRAIGIGEEPRWSPSGKAILAVVRTAYKTYLTAYDLEGGLVLAPEELPGNFEGASWSTGALKAELFNQQDTPQPAWVDVLDDSVQRSGKRMVTANLDGVIVPYPQLSQAAREPFEALRERSAQLLGWDALSNLEYAFAPLDEPLPPARQQDWLYTGRAFSLHSGLLGAGWLAAVREEFDGQTYWRIYLRAAQSDGSLGRPLTARPWDYAARYNGTQSNFLAGGKLAGNIPDGYWIDFTALAAQYGFERLPALPNWRSYFQGALFNEFALRAGLSWEQAMLQLYPPEAVATAEAGSN